MSEQAPPPLPEEPQAPIAVEAPSFARPLVAGLAAAVAGAVGWALITVMTHYKLGLVAIGIGFLVAAAVRKFGGARSQPHAIMSGALALLGCLLGDLFSACGLAAIQENMSVVPVVLGVLFNPPVAVKVISEGFTPMDLLFYAIAAYEGFKLVLK